MSDSNKNNIGSPEAHEALPAVETAHAVSAFNSLKRVQATEQDPALAELTAVERVIIALDLDFKASTPESAQSLYNLDELSAYGIEAATTLDEFATALACAKAYSDINRNVGGHYIVYGSRSSKEYDAIRAARGKVRVSNTADTPSRAFDRALNFIDAGYEPDDVLDVLVPGLQKEPYYRPGDEPNARMRDIPYPEATQFALKELGMQSEPALFGVKFLGGEFDHLDLTSKQKLSLIYLLDIGYCEDKLPITLNQMAIFIDGQSSIGRSTSGEAISVTKASIFHFAAERFKQDTWAENDPQERRRKEHAVSYPRVAAGLTIGLLDLLGSQEAANNQLARNLGNSLGEDYANKKDSKASIINLANILAARINPHLGEEQQMSHLKLDDPSSATVALDRIIDAVWRSIESSKPSGQADLTELQRSMAHDMHICAKYLLGV